MRMRDSFKGVAAGALLVAASMVAAGPNEPSQTPLYVSESAPALNMLVMGRDHKLYYEAYNDASDLDDDGVIDVGFKPEVKYYGYFNSSVCYNYSTTNGRFEPSAAVDATTNVCTSAWHGNFLNYLTTSRMDALRKVLYGGYRATDSTTETVLQAAFIPQDAHSWGKEYARTDSYNIGDYAPLSEPGVGRRHLFAVTTLTDGGIPQLRVLTNTSFRAWNWVSIERPVAGSDCFNESNNRVGCLTGGPSGSGWEIVPASQFSNLTYTTWPDMGGSPTNAAQMDDLFYGFTSTSPGGNMCSPGPVSISSINTGNNFNVQISSDAPLGCGQDNYRTLITGTLRVSETGSYNFAIAGDDAIDVVIGSTIVAGHYGAHSMDTSDTGLDSHSGSISLVADTDYIIRVRHKEDGGDASWRLYWKPVGGNGGASTMTDHSLQVVVCPASNSALREETCKPYPNNGTALYKPTGLLHDFGESDRMYFGLLTGSYVNNLSGGVLRSNMNSFSREVNTTTGQFNAVSDGIVSTINKLRTIDISNYGTSSSQYSCGWITTRPINNGECSMWGNPIAEMMYETLRYFGGATAGRSEYAYTGSVKDSQSPLQLPAPAWKPPYVAEASGGGGYKQCSKPVMTVISDINPSYDYKLPGSRWASSFNSTSDPASLTSLNVATETDAIGAAEGIDGNSYFIGESQYGLTDAKADGAPTVKTINGLSRSRGLSPEEPTKQGTYYSAGVAKFGAENAISGDNKVMTYAVALASPLPKIEFPVGNSTVTVVPFAKSVGGSSISATSNFQPTDQIVDYYVTRIANTGASDIDLTVNDGRPYAEFSINYEDVEQGADHDMDAIARYTLSVTADNRLQIDIDSEYAAGGIDQYMGYVISGTTADGIYLEVKDRGGADVAYKLNTPAGELPGFCDTTPMPSKCTGLPLQASRTFEASGVAGAGLLNDPLWYAAKYGIPDRAADTVEGTPDNYFLVTNALTLKERLARAFESIVQRTSSVTSPAVVVSFSADAVDNSRAIYKTSYDVRTWSGDVIKVTNNADLTGAGWDASKRMPSPANRVIRMTNSSGNGLVPFTWSNLRARGTNGVFGGVNLQQVLASDPDNPGVLPVVDANGELVDNDDVTEGQRRLDFVTGADTSYRPRDSLLGDILGSSPVVVKGAMYLDYLADRIDGDVGDYGAFIADQLDREGRIYVGANDGMLHAFDMASGEEKFAFVPSAVIQNLNKLTSPDYNEEGGLHQFFVDGTPVVRDVYINNAWRTVLVGTLGAGGKALFALDVTDPDNIALLWEFNEGDDLQGTETVSDMGYSFPKPTLARLHSGQWAVVTGNGYDSASGRAVLLLIDIATGQLIRKLPVATSGDNAVNNGLSSVRVADNNSDGFAEYVYAGDLKGNLWRFDLINTGRANPLTPAATPDNASTFKVSFGGSPLYVAKDGSDKAQPITAPPSLVRHPSATGYIVMFGTGRYFTLADKTSTGDMQTLYGIWDKQTRGETAATTPTLGRSDLQEQGFEVEVEAPFAGITRARVLSNTPVDWKFSATVGSKMGWYLDLAVDGDIEGERVVDEMYPRGKVLLFSTRTPAVDSCTGGLTGFTYGIDPRTGGRTAFNVFDLDNDGYVNMGDAITLSDGSKVVGSGYQSPAGGFTPIGSHIVDTNGLERIFSSGNDDTGRQNWRVVPND